MTFTAPKLYQEFTDIVEMAFGYTSASDLTTAVWTDVSRYVRGGITITKGRQNLTSTASPTSVQFTLNNTDARFTPGNPLSPYWPNVVRNVPCRVRRTWVGAAGTYERATAFVNGWPIQPNAGVADVTIAIVATGRLRRLRRSGKKIGSASTLAIGPTSPTFWLPMEEGSAATQLASGLAGVRPLLVPANVAPGAAGAPGSGASLDFSGGGQLTANVTTSATGWRVAFGFNSQTATAQYLPLHWVTTSGVTWEIGVTVAPTDTSVNVGTLVGGSTSIYTGGVLPIWPAGTWHSLIVDAAQNGANVDMTVTIDGVAAVYPSAFTTMTLGGIQQWIANPAVSTVLGSNSSAFNMTELAIWSPWSSTLNLSQALQGYSGELATARATRVCALIGIPINIVAGVVPSQPMGPQTRDTLGNILASCEDVDNGLLHDGGTLGNLVLVSGAALYNAPVTLPLDYVHHQISDGYAGTFDDQDLVNSWTISRPGGSSATSVNTASLAIDDDYDQEDSPNVATDGQIQLIADWRTHVDSYEAMRFPLTPIDLRRSPELALAVTSMSLPVKLGPTNLPTPAYPYGNIDQFGVGYKEILDSVAWQIGFNSTPAAPYRVAGVQDPTNPWRLECAASTLTAGINASVTSMQVTTASGPTLSTASADYPCDMYLDGEQITIVSPPGGSTSPQTVTISRSANGVVKSHTAGLPITLYRPAAIAL